VTELEIVLFGCQTSRSRDQSQLCLTDSTIEIIGEPRAAEDMRSGYSFPRPASRARMAACTRSATCSLLKMFET
jgi:hypothetical protein